MITNLLKRFFRTERKQTPQPQSYLAANRWFKEPLQRNLPLTPADFNLFEIPSYSLNKWTEAISSEPWHTHCFIIEIKNLGSTARTLFDVLKKKHDLTSAEAVDIFNNYLGAACPECLGGLTGELFQTIETSKNTSGVVLLDGEPGLQRILDGTCSNCSSKNYYVVWYGEKK